MIASRVEQNNVGHKSCLCNISGQAMSSGQNPSLVYDRTIEEATVVSTKRNLPRCKIQRCVRTTYGSVQSPFIFYFWLPSSYTRRLEICRPGVKRIRKCCDIPTFVQLQMKDKIRNRFESFRVALARLLCTHYQEKDNLRKGKGDTTINRTGLINYIYLLNQCRLINVMLTIKSILDKND